VRREDRRKRLLDDVWAADCRRGKEWGHAEQQRLERIID
jgi:hypothetical protein